MNRVPEVGVPELRAALEAGRPMQVLDVRPAEERAEWWIPQSQHLDVYDDLQRNQTGRLREGVRGWSRADPVVVVCAAGRTSLLAADALRQLGFQAYSLSGGMTAWSGAWNRAEVPPPVGEVDVIQVRRTGKGCLSYIVGSRGEAAVIDPALDAEVFLNVAAERGWSITAVLDTHIHADHRSRSRELAQRSGATLWLPAQERARFPFSAVADGDVVNVGGATVEVIHTPGHTPESVCYRVGDALFTGDTLFLSAVGRPDLETDVAGARGRAQALYRSLQRLRRLPATTMVLPGHSDRPISFDGRPIAGGLGAIFERLAMLDGPETEFVEGILARIPPTPPNHHRIVELNEAGVATELDPAQLEAGANRCAVS